MVARGLHDLTRLLASVGQRDATFPLPHGRGDKARSGGLQPDLKRVREPLEAYPLENLKMVGTLSQQKQVFALIKTPDSNLFRVKQGNYLGQNFGLITEINEGSVKLKEIVQDSAGDWTERVSTLQLQDEQEVAKK